MFSKIMTPVDLAHVDKLRQALRCAADLANLYGAELVYVGVTSETPGAVAHNPAEYAEKLKAFAAEQGTAHGINTSSHAVASHDPSIDLDETLIKAIDTLGADLVVMQSHVPNFTDYIWPSNGGTLASHATVSVMLVRV